MSQSSAYAAIIEEIFIERHYKLVDPNELTAEDLAAYRQRT